MASRAPASTAVTQATVSACGYHAPLPPVGLGGLQAPHQAVPGCGRMRQLAISLTAIGVEEEQRARAARGALDDWRDLAQRHLDDVEVLGLVLPPDGGTKLRDGVLLPPELDGRWRGEQPPQQSQPGSRRGPVVPRDSAHIHVEPLQRSRRLPRFEPAREQRDIVAARRGLEVDELGAPSAAPVGIWEVGRDPQHLHGLAAPRVGSVATALERPPRCQRSAAPASLRFGPVRNQLADARRPTSRATAAIIRPRCLAMKR